MTTVNIPARKSETKGDCSGKCNLSFKYQASACTVTNKGYYLSLGYEHNDSQVVYNNSNYKVENIRLYTPSINKFNGSRADAELVVLHKNNRNEYLAVCVPIKKDNTSNPSSILLNQIISATPVQRNKISNVSVTNYSLNHFIPKAPFFSHVGPLPWDLTIRNVNYVIFDTSVSIAKIDNRTFKLLTQLINEKDFTVSKLTNLYYNKKGSTNIGGGKDKEIFIDCQRVTPDGFSKERIQEEVPTNPSENSLTRFLSSDLFSTIITVIGIIAGFIFLIGGAMKGMTWWRQRQSRIFSSRTVPFRTRSSTSSTQSST